MKQRVYRLRSMTLFFMLSAVLAAAPVFASTTDGTIDATYRYAWGENIGWIDFGTANGAVHVTDAGLSGYALSETAGWINLEDVVNDGNGNLSGYAWGENVGWINFDPANGGVVIDSSGVFTGSALGENIGWIVFGGSYPAKTDWRSASVRSSTGSANAQGGGGGLPAYAYQPPSPPAQGFQVSINAGADETTSRVISLTLTATTSSKYVVISEMPSFVEGTQQSISSQGTAMYVLSEGAGLKTVYVKFCTEWGVCSSAFSDSITYTGTGSVPLPAPGTGGSGSSPTSTAATPCGLGAGGGASASFVSRLKGYILLQVQCRGEAWYVNPVDGYRYYMKDGATAYQMLRSFGLGVSESDYAKIAAGDLVLKNRLRGRIILRVHARGEAYYVHPKTLQVYYLKDGAEAYRIMRLYSLGITNADLAKLVQNAIPIK